jgi:hypothetical protein
VLNILCICFLFCKFSFSVEVIAPKPFRDPGCQYQRPFFMSRLPVCCFFSVFIQNRGLFRLSPRVPARCFGSARICTRAVLVIVAGLIGSFSAWVGKSSPPVVRRAPLRGIESGDAHSAGWGILSLACVC